MSLFIRGLGAALLPFAACTAPHVDGAARATAGEEAISPARLESLLVAFAHDSMSGREAGTEGARRAARFIAAELERIGVAPAGEGGSYFQSVPLVARSADPSSSIRLGVEPLVAGTDFLAARPALPTLPAREVDIVVAGTLGQPQSMWASAEQLRGKAAVFLPPAAVTTQLRRVVPSVPGDRSPVAEAAALIFILPDPIDEAQRQAARASSIEMSFASQSRARVAPPTVYVSPAVGHRLLGKPPSEARAGDAGARVTVDVRPLEEPRPTWNVVAVVRGSDPALRTQYVAIGAHLDHVGTGRPSDADSARAWLAAVQELRRANGWRAPSRAQLDAIRIDVDSLRRAGAARRDSIFNGADDDGSGSMAMLEIARSLQMLRPRRSILLVWHTAEELGLYGAEYFTRRPTVPRDSIVAQLNLDMIGRGTAADLRGGGADYLQLIGSRRLSTELGDLIDAVNAERARPFVFDLQFDAAGHPEQYYCRSDHYMYARFGIPVAFFTTGSHIDYHRLTDEPRYIDYRKLADVGRLVRDVALRLADQDRRPVVDGPRPDPDGECRQ